MKYLEILALEQLSSGLRNKVLLGGRTLNGRIEAYSTKKAGENKKQSRLLEQKFDQRLVSKSTVRLLVDLIQTLNASMLDYDFSSLKPESFVLVTPSQCVSSANAHLAELTVENPSFLSSMWKAINDSITLSNCEVYCLADNPFVDSEDDIIWSFFYLLYNKELKRILLFACEATSRLARRNSVFDASCDNEVDDDDDDNMDDDGDVDDDDTDPRGGGESVFDNISNGNASDRSRSYSRDDHKHSHTSNMTLERISDIGQDQFDIMYESDGSVDLQ